MTEKIKHTLSIFSLFLLPVLTGGCENEQLLAPEAEKQDTTVKVVFYTDPYTKAGAQTPINSISLWAFAHQEDGMITNFAHEVSNPGDLFIVMNSNFFEKNDKNDITHHTTLYAIANVERVNLSGTLQQTYNTLEQYTEKMKDKQQKFLTAKPYIPIPSKDEAMLKELITRSNSLPGQTTNMSTPLMTSLCTVIGGASQIFMPLERVSCRVWFKFIITGNQGTDKLTINSIKLSNLKSDTYLFIEDAIPSSTNHENSWTYTAGTAVFKVDDGQYQTQPLSAGNTALTLCASASNPEPFYFYSYQSIGDTDDFDPIITLSIANEDGTAKTLTAPLYDPTSNGGKKHHGLHRNHSYEVVSTINAGTLKLEGVATRSHDWFDRGEIEFPSFE